MKWMDNLEHLAQGKGCGKCPYCGSLNMDALCVVVDSTTRMGYGDLWCNDCKRAFHISRMQIPDCAKTTGTLPNGLRY